MKKLISLILTLALFLSISTIAFAAETGASSTLKLDHTSIAVQIGETTYLNASVNSAMTTDVNWSINDSSIATISGGAITGNRLGTTVATATNSWGQSASCYVHVSLKGIDVSSWQGSINWSAVKTAGVDFAIVRTGYGKTAPEKQTDTYFAANYTGAVQNNIKVGVYHYSYAETAADAVQEANLCLGILNGRSLDYPVFYDIENPVHRTMDKEKLADTVDAFCSTIQAAGYQTGIYSSPSLYNSTLSSTRLDKYERWVASWGRDLPNFQKPYTMWQYAYGTMPGISGNVDLNYSFKDYSSIGTPTIPTTSISCDTVGSYTFGTNKSYYYKVTTNSTSTPTATSSNPEVVSVSYGKAVAGGHVFQINNLEAGSATITTSTSDGISVSFEAYGTSAPVFVTSMSCDTVHPYTFGANNDYYYKITTNCATAPIATSSNVTAVSVSFCKKVSDGYIYKISNIGPGTATIATSAPDGTSVNFEATGTVANSPATTLVSDTTHTYTFGTNNAYYYKITTNSATAPTATSSNATAVSVSFCKKVSDGYIYKISNIGQGTATITTSASDGASVNFEATGNGVSISVPTSSKLKCDTNSPFTMQKGQLYTFLFTTSAGAGKPYFATGNGSVVTTAGVKTRNGAYLVTVKALKSGGTGMYATLPGQQPVQYCIISVA